MDDLKIGIPSELITGYPLVRSTALVLVAHDYKYDLPVLRHALATDVGYIGMLGSSRRGAAILKLLREEGVDEALAQPRARADRPRPGRQERAGDRAGGAGRDPGRARRRDRPADERRRSGRAMKAIAHAAGDGRGRRPRRPRPVPRRPRSRPPGGRRPRAPGSTPRWRPRCSRCRGRRSICSRSTPATCTRRRPASGWPPRWSATASRSRATRAGSGRWRRRAAACCGSPTQPLTDVNAHEGISVFTLFGGQPVEPGETVAKAKVTPLAIPEPTIAGHRDPGARRPAASWPWPASSLTTVGRRRAREPRCQAARPLRDAP